MKCEVCREFLEEYLDGELTPQDHEQVNAHLIACVDCSDSFAMLSAEQELFARYDREIEVPPFLWTRVAAHTAPECNAPKPKRFWLPGAVAVSMIAIAFGVGYWLSNRQTPERVVAKSPSHIATPNPNPVPQSVPSASPKARKKSRSRVKPVVITPTPNESDVLSSDLAYLDMEEQDTAKHIEQSKMLLRSIKNVQISDTDDESTSPTTKLYRVAC